MDATTIRNELITAARFRLQRFQELISLAQEQRAILLERRHADLPENLRRHDPLLIELAKVEKREESLLGMLAATERRQRHCVRYRSIACRAYPDFEAQYAEINRETRALALTLQTLVAGNTQLLETMMEYVQFSIGIMAKLMCEQQSYDPAADPGTAALLLDRKV